MYITILGSLCLGFVIGWLVRYFLARLQAFTIQALATVVSILVGGTVAKFLNADPFNVGTWFYPVGLLIGVLAYPLVAKLGG